MDIKKFIKTSKLVWIFGIVGFSLGFITAILAMIEGVFWRYDDYYNYGSFDYWNSYEITIFFWIWTVLLAGWGIVVIVYSIIFLVQSSKYKGDKTIKALALTSSIIFVSVYGLNLIFSFFLWGWWGWIASCGEIAAFVICIITWVKLRKMYGNGETAQNGQFVMNQSVASKPVSSSNSNKGAATLSDKIHELDSLKQKGLIDEKEFKEAKAKLLAKAHE